MTIRIIKHEAVPKCGSYEVRFSDGRPRKYFYWEDIPGRRLRSDHSSQALKDAKAFARAERDRTYQLTLLQGFFDGLGKYKIANEDNRPMA